MSATCTHHELEAWDHLDCRGCMVLLRQTEEQIASEMPYWTVPEIPGTPLEDATGEMARTEMMFAVRRRYHSAGMRLFSDSAVPSGTLDDRRALVLPPPPRPLLDGDTTPEDLEAVRDQPRPGVWAGENDADLRALTQDETDALIRAELIKLASPSERDGIVAACGGSALAMALEPRDAAGQVIDLPSVGPRTQRGGIDSDPLVRVLARRAWGDRGRNPNDSDDPSRRPPR